MVVISSMNIIYLVVGGARCPDAARGHRLARRPRGEHRDPNEGKVAFEANVRVL
jgi:hypothetical protein